MLDVKLVGEAEADVAVDAGTGVVARIGETGMVTRTEMTLSPERI